MTPAVETTHGRLEGREREGVLLFAGIPYAAPPVGPLRFRPPQPHPGWAGLRDATRFGPMAAQQPALLEMLMGAGREPEWSEDCLTLNVVTPGLDRADRPVMVWIHGGGFTTGTGAMPWYDGTSFARRGDLVVVTINYRLGAFGFLHLGEHADDEPGSGNAGLLDQVAALEWVRDNIDRFGGDPSQVTIFGESAGGMSVGTLAGLPAARGLFHRAIPQSGAAHNVRSGSEAAEVTDRLLQVLERSTPAGLRDVPAEQLLAAQGEVTKALTRERVRHGGGIGLHFEPVVDGDLLDRQPLEAIRAGAANDVQLLVGTTRDEWNVFALAFRGGVELDDLRRRVGRLFPDPEPVIETYRRNRPEATLDTVWNAIATDHVFRIPAIRLAEAHAEAGGPAVGGDYMYRFDWPSSAFDGRFQACHALEIPFVFHVLDRNGVDAFCGGPPPVAVADAMHDAWIAFVREGDPNHRGLPSWSPYDPSRRATMLFNETSAPVDDPDGDERALWVGVR